MIDFYDLKYISSLTKNIVAKIYSDQVLDTVIDMDYCLKKLRIYVEENDLGNTYSIFRISENKAYLTINKKLNIPKYEKDFIKAVSIGRTVYEMFQENSLNEDIIYLDENKLLNNYFDLKEDNNPKKTKEFFVLNFAAIFIVPQKKLEDILKVGICNRDAISSIFKTCKLLIEKRINDLKKVKDEKRKW